MTITNARDPYCLERWPECEPGGHDPRCCRFPKSCSCNVLPDDPARADELKPVPANLAERALTSARAAELTTATRAKVAAALEAPAEERELLVIDALALAVEALDALTALLLAGRDA